MSEQRIDFDGLRMVGRAVEEAPDTRFDMRHWVCGTTCCAVGWFCLANPEDFLQMTGSTIQPIPVYAGWDNYDAVAARFGLTEQQCSLLFHPNSWLEETKETKSSFLARLAQFIADHEPKPPVEVKTDAAFMRSLDPIALRNAEDDAGAVMVDSDCDGMG